MKNIYILMVCMLSLLTTCQGQDEPAPTTWNDFTTQFQEKYKALDLPYFVIDYVENLEKIQDEVSILNQEKEFRFFENSLRRFDFNRLSPSEKLDYKIINYETQLNLHRIALEKKWLKIKPKTIPTTGVSDLPFGKEWYTYLLKKWIDQTVTPEELFEFGKREVKRVSSKMKAVQQRSGMDQASFQKHINSPDFFYKTPEEVQAAFEEMKKIVDKNLAKNFPYTTLLPDVKIARSTRELSVKTPAYYRSGEHTFYYNFFDTPFNKRQIGWIYIHEAMPGHHYQIAATNTLNRTDIQKMFRYSCYREGWAAYIEEIGYDIGAYRDIYDELGKWEWDIIRSVRVVLDVGLNYYGWTDEQALEYWKQYIYGQDDIALREIDRMTRWPAQVITYKYGTEKIMKWRKIYEQRKDFEAIDFHREMIVHGELPFSILEEELDLIPLKGINDIPYLEKSKMENDSLQRLNLVLPELVNNPPLLLWIGGGAWSYVDRNQEMNVARKLAKEGIAVASVGHRLSTAVWRDPKLNKGIQHPKHMEDIAAAFKWLFDHAEEYGYDKNRIFVGGFSSGAHLAALLSVDDKYLKKHGLSLSDIKGAIPIGGTYDVSNYHQAFVNGSRPALADEHVKAVFGDTEKHFEEASPISYLEKLSVPLLVMSDQNMFNYTQIFEDAIRATDFRDFEVHYVHRLNHGDLWRNLSFAEKSIYRDLIVNFVMGKR